MHTSSLDILEKSQLSSPQAKAILQVMEVELSAQHELLATKSDLRAFASDLSSEIRATRAELLAAVSAANFDLRTDMSATKAELKADIARLDLRIESTRVDAARWIIASIGVMLGAFYFFLNYARK